MKILLLTPYFPYPLNNGGIIRVYHLMVNLATRHEVTVLCLDPVSEAQKEGLAVIKKHGINIETVPVAKSQKLEHKRFYQLLSLASFKPYQYKKFYSHAMQKLLNKHLQHGNYDLFMAEFSQMGYYHMRTSIPRYIDQHNVEYEIMQRTYETEKNPLRKLLAYSEYKKFYRQEITNCNKFTACLTTSQRDAEIIQSRSPDLQCHVIPNGVDSDFFRRGSEQADPNMILFTGTISYYPNTEGILWFHKTTWPLIKAKNPDAKFCIAGKEPPVEVKRLAETDDSIIVTGTVDDMRDYYNKAAVVVVPLRVGGGTRLKILEGMAMEKAIVSTSMGAEGIDHTNGENILLTDTPEDFCDAIVSVMSDATVRSKLEKGGRALVEEKYDWQAVSATLSDVFETKYRKTA